MMVATTSMALPADDQTAIPATAAGGGQVSSPVADAQARALAIAVGRGDEAAFRQLYDHYHERLFRLLVVIGRGDEALAHDLVQSVMLTAAAKLKPVESEEHLWNWLARVARQHLSKARRQRRREPELVTLAELPEPAGAVEPEAVLEEGLDAALLALETEDRQAVEWFYFEGLSHKEIAERVGGTPKAVSSRLERARAKLRSLLTRRLSHET
jgi:RNA polymerase sigma-70 factor (ECF subfamily)